MVDEVREEFGTAGELILRLYRDPEAQDEYLSLYVRQWPYDASVMDRINGISERFEAELADCSGWLLLTSDFRKPGGADAAV
ncbi:MAG TPA: hypothetical protein VFA18_08705 [Gemmataceae bacterium]|nr:hypothetical protein [Gemmataceae bacterium]